MFPIEQYWGKRVLITGHTGFKGTWLCRMLLHAGAEVTGYALRPKPGEPSLFELTGTDREVKTYNGDIRDFKALRKAFMDARPEIVIHMAAQPLVRDSYRTPVYTYETNVMGTVNILECIRLSDATISFVNVTTDKVYENREWEWGYRETERLDGYDPYSNSKSCSELVTRCYKDSFFTGGDIQISTVRAGNVIGGGDFARDRIIPDCMRAALEDRDILVRNPSSVRPYQFVLEPLYVYLMVAEKQAEDAKYAGCYNVGPDEADCLQTGALVDAFIERWGKKLRRISLNDTGPHEANYLKLDSARLKNTFGWKPQYHIGTALNLVVEWLYCYISGENPALCMDSQINQFLQIAALTSKNRGG